MKKLLFALLFCATSHFAAAAGSFLDLGAPSAGTPYDRYMTPVKNVLIQLRGEETSMQRVRELMHVGRNFRYSFTEPYTAASPARTASIRAGDCKAKALWLADQLQDENVRFVIGKARSSSRISHAWLMWQHDSRWWILDCTNLREPIAADRVSSSEYIPFYSFSKEGTYRHRATASLFADATAGGKSLPVASLKDNR